MSNKKDPFYITTAISYLNGSPHLGHAYEALFDGCYGPFQKA